MTVNPHPFALTWLAEQRLADLLTSADQRRLAAQNRTEVAPRPSWPNLATVAAVVAVLAFGAVWL